MTFLKGSLIPGEGIRVAVIHLPSSTTFPPKFGNAAHRTAYKDEMVGTRMEAELALTYHKHLQTSFCSFINNQLSIKELSQNLGLHQVAPYNREPPIILKNQINLPQQQV